MLKGRLGLETARISHADRAGLLYLARGALTAQDGTLTFKRGPEPSLADALAPGVYAVPLQSISMILLGPGSTVSHDALRLLARARTALAAVGEDGVRLYTAPPLIPDHSGLARRQARVWADEERRLSIAGKLLKGGRARLPRTRGDRPFPAPTPGRGHRATPARGLASDFRGYCARALLSQERSTAVARTAAVNQDEMNMGKVGKSRIAHQPFEVHIRIQPMTARIAGR